MQTILVIIDGIGLADALAAGNAVTRKTLPTLFAAMDAHGYAELEASGTAVGLDPEQTGNSEVGHLTIGAGFVVPSTLSRIQGAFTDGSWAAHQIWRELAKSPRLHIVGLLSDAGTHGHWVNLQRAAFLARAAGISRVILHPVLDGVDSQAGSAPALLDRLAPTCSDPSVQLGLIMGRTSFCDRSGNRDLSACYRDALTGTLELPQFTSAALMHHLTCSSERSFPGHRYKATELVQDGEPVLLTQHRADRATQVAEVIAERNPVYSLVELHGVVPQARVFFPTQALTHGLPFELKAFGLTSVRIAEECKYPHVTFFFNGLNSDLEGRAVCVPSINDTEISRHPEMSCSAIAKATIEAMKSDADLIIVNLANLDQVGHLGDYSLAVRAARHVDAALADIMHATRLAGSVLILTSDHGNADRMLDVDGMPFGSHTERPVPFTVVPPPGKSVLWRHRHGSIAQVAPTVLETLGLPRPTYMTKSLASVR